MAATSPITGLARDSILSRWLAGVLAALMAVSPIAAQASVAAPDAAGSSPGAKAKESAKPSAKKHTSSSGRTSKAGRASQPGHAARAARTARIHQAFVASSELRPMAQQLATLRTPAAYEGVARFAHAHTGEGAAAAYLALGHAYLVDRQFAQASDNLHLARQAGQELADYADFLGAQANHEAGNQAAAVAELQGFAARYPDSIFVPQVPELEADVDLTLNNAAAAQRVLDEGTPSAGRPGYQLAQAQVAAALGQTAQAEQMFKRLLLAHPLTGEAATARAKLIAMGAESTLTVAELRSLGDAYYHAGHYADAAEQYRALARSAALDAAARNGFAVDAAACDLRLKRLTTQQAEALADSNDENGARRLYLLMELARTRTDVDGVRHIVDELKTRFPRSPWLAEAVFSTGNMYLLKREYPAAIESYSYMAAHFPESTDAAAAHWRAGWLSYRLGLYADAARLFDEQIKLYPSDKETVSAIYWRGRLYETLDHKPANAVANYRTLVRVYQHYFYAQMARRRLAALGSTQQIAAASQLDLMEAPPVPALQESFPSDSPHLAKARLLANAGLNEYIPAEIAADPDSGSWSALAEAQIYASYGETYRAMRALKRALPFAASASIKAIPLVYWRILYPEAWWQTIKTESAKNNLDPYLVASLIRQESEFNPSVISYANAYGLMQLLPSTGKAMAREEGMKNFQTFQLLDPETNIRLGCRYLREMLDKLGGVQEYALAAYNAGDGRVLDWESAGPYTGMDEFVESIPITQTREYVEAILRNEETYRAIDDVATPQTRAGVGGSR
jgi:soluble lytic murein transglycosylase